MPSPYAGLPVSAWKEQTYKLISEHPLAPSEIYEVVVKVWKSIFDSKIGSKPFQIGVDLFPRPQIMAFFLHELIPLEFAFRHPTMWRREETVDEKDLVYVQDPHYSIEIKTSSSAKSVFGNRSYAQGSASSKKSKSGYYLAINFQSFSSSRTPNVTLVRFGWLDHSDWIGQTSATGQQARLHPDAERYKLLSLPFLE